MEKPSRNQPLVGLVDGHGLACRAKASSSLGSPRTVLASPASRDKRVGLCSSYFRQPTALLWPDASRRLGSALVCRKACWHEFVRPQCRNSSRRRACGFHSGNSFWWSILPIRRFRLRGFSGSFGSFRILTNSLGRSFGYSRSRCHCVLPPGTASWGNRKQLSYTI